LSCRALLPAARAARAALLLAWATAACTLPVDPAAPEAPRAARSTDRVASDAQAPGQSTPDRTAADAPASDAPGLAEAAGGGLDDAWTGLHGLWADELTGAPPFVPRLEVLVALDGSGDFCSLAEAVAVVPAGTRVLVGAGTHEGNLRIDKPLLLEAAAGRPTLQARDGPVCFVDGGPLLLRNLIVRAAPGAAALVVASGDVDTDRCLFAGSDGDGLQLSGSATRVRLLQSSVTAAPCLGIDLRDGARLRLQDSEISRCGTALSVSGGVLDARGGRIATNRIGLLASGPGSSELHGTWFWSHGSSAVRLAAGAQATLREVRIRSPGGLPGVLVTGGAQGLFEGCTITGTPAEDDHHTEGMTRDHVATELRDGTDHHILTGLVTIEDGAHPTFRDCRIESALGHGLLLRRAGGSFERTTIAASVFYNVFMEDGADPLFRHCTITTAGENGVFAWLDAAGLFEDCTLQANGAYTEDRNRWAQLVLCEGARTRLLRCSIVDGGGAGVVVSGFGTTGELRDCEVARNGGVGLTIAAGAAPRVHGGSLSSNADNGLWVTRDGGGRLHDVTCSDNRRLGVRIDVQSHPRLERCRIERNRGGGLLVRRDSQPQFVECVVNANEGHGLQVDFDGRPTLERCTLAGNQGLGVFVAAPGEARLVECAIEGNVAGDVEAEEGASVFRGGSTGGR